MPTNNFIKTKSTNGKASHALNKKINVIENK